MPQANDAPRYHAPRLMLITRPRSRASQVSATSIDPSTHSPFSAKPTAHRAAKDREGGRQRQQRAAPAAIGQPRPEVTARRCRRSPSLARWRWRWRCAYGSGCDGRRVGDCTVVRAQHMPSLKRTCRNRATFGVPLRPASNGTTVVLLIGCSPQTTPCFSVGARFVGAILQPAPGASQAPGYLAAAAPRLWRQASRRNDGSGRLDRAISASMRRDSLIRGPSPDPTRLGPRQPR